MKKHAAKEHDHKDKHHKDHHKDGKHDGKVAKKEPTAKKK